MQAFAGLAKQGNALIVPADLSNLSSLIASAMTVVRQPGAVAAPVPPRG